MNSVSVSNAKAHLTIDVGDYVYEFDGFLDDATIKRHADYEDISYEYLWQNRHVVPGGFFHWFTTNLQWSARGLKFDQHAKPKPVPTDLPNMGEFYD